MRVGRCADVDDVYGVDQLGRGVERSESALGGEVVRRARVREVTPTTSTGTP